MTKMKIEETNIMFPDEPAVFVPDDLLRRMEQAMRMMETSLELSKNNTVKKTLPHCVLNQVQDHPQYPIN